LKKSAKILELEITRNRTKFIWLALDIIYFGDVIYNASCRLSVRCCSYRDTQVSCQIVVPLVIELQYVAQW